MLTKSERYILENIHTTGWVLFYEGRASIEVLDRPRTLYGVQLEVALKLRGQGFIDNYSPDPDSPLVLEDKYIATMKGLIEIGVMKTEKPKVPRKPYQIKCLNCGEMRWSNEHCKFCKGYKEKGYERIGDAIYFNGQLDHYTRGKR